MSVRYVGDKTLWEGKRVFEILCNLRNFGVGRYLIRKDDQWRYPGTKSFYKILSAEPHMDEHLNKGTVMVEKVFRDVRYPESVELGEEIGYPDWQLVPKTDESDLKDFVGKSPTIHIYPRRIAPPPLLADVLLREQRQKGILNPQTPTMKVSFPEVLNKEYAEQWRCAAEGETPNASWDIPPRKAVPGCPLYDGVEEMEVEVSDVPPAHEIDSIKTGGSPIYRNPRAPKPEEQTS